ncbi:MAG: laminin G domain-containing protein, partial [Opitutales bacterium]
NNVSINPGGFKNWKHQQGNGSSRFGFAYYLDGAFKNYLFNNVAIGRNNDEMSKYANTSAFQGIIGFQNEFFNNTAHKFLSGSRQQAPDTGRYKYLGNVFSDISVRLFRHTDINGDQNPNDDHYDQGSHFGYEHMAYANNVVANLTGSAGGFEEDGTDYPDTPGYQAALDALNTLAHDEAFRSAATPFANADGDDFTPSLDAGMIGGSVQVFVPWALAATVAEWPFHQNHNDPNVIIDEHWYMLDYYRNRSNYKDTPRYPLQGSGLDATDYVAGTLEDWTRSALQFSDGKYASLPHSSLTGSFSVGGSDWPGSARRTVDMQENSFLIEAVVRRDDDADGVLVRKMDGTAGYALEVVSGALQVTLKTSGGTLQVPGPELPQGQFHHVLVEVDRGAINQVTLYLNGEPAATEGPVPGGSLSNSADFLVAGGRDQEPLECTFDFLRIARSTLAESRTTIDELVAWQFEGPFLRDFTGASRHFASTAAGAIGSPGDTDSDHLDDLWELDQTGDLSPTTTGDTAQRGTSNLLRFALDIDPKSGVQLSTEPLHIDTERVPGEKWLVLRYRKSTAADHLQISVWRCDSLTAAPEDWVEVVPDGSQIHQSVAHPNPDGDGSAILMEMRCRLAPSQGQGFYRVKVAPQ